MNHRPRVVLYNPRAVFFTMPLSLIAIASALDRDKVEVVIIDGRLESDPIGAVVEAARGALCVGITVLTGAPIHDALAVSRAVKASQPDCPIVWGGWHPSLFADECLDDPSVDIVVSGQGEDAFRHIVDQLIDGDRADQSHARALKDLNEFPAHDYSLIPVEKYFALKGARQIDYISSQGCRFRCAFCADPAVFARGWTGLAPERVADEVAFLRRKYAFDDLAFQDETFFTHAGRVAAIADEIRRRDLSFSGRDVLHQRTAC